MPLWQLVDMDGAKEINNLQYIHRNIIKITLAAVAVTFSISPAFAQRPGSERSAAAVMKVEHEWQTALNQHDVATLERILGREYIDSYFAGQAITRAQYLAHFSRSVPRPAPPVKQRFEDTKVRFVAHGDVAIVTGVVVTVPAAESKHQTAARPETVHSRFTDVFVWRDARWQAVTGQETHFTPH